MVRFIAGKMEFRFLVAHIVALFMLMIVFADLLLNLSHGHSSINLISKTNFTGTSVPVFFCSEFFLFEKISSKIFLLNTISGVVVVLLIDKIYNLVLFL
jgi:hypothetical protein